MTVEAVRFGTVFGTISRNTLRLNRDRLLTEQARLKTVS